MRAAAAPARQPQTDSPPRTGRVTRASVKNFQLIKPGEPDHILVQHGRVGSDTFTMDVSWPLSVIQAFAICLSALTMKLGVE